MTHAKKGLLSAAHEHSLISAGSLIAFLLLWQLFTGLGLVAPEFLPSPISVVARLFSALTTASFFLDVGVSVFRVMTGFVLAALIAIPLGVYMGTLKWVEAAFAPIIGFVRYLPVPAFIPLCILWFGIGEVEKISIIFIGTFFQLSLMVMDKVIMVPKEFLEIGSTCGLSRGQNIRRIVVPAIMPAVFDDLRIAVGWAWSYLVVAEIVAANRGLGFLIMEGQRYLQTEMVMVGMLAIGMLGIAFDFSFKGLRKMLFPWLKGVELR